MYKNGHTQIKPWLENLVMAALLVIWKHKWQEGGGLCKKYYILKNGHIW